MVSYILQQLPSEYKCHLDADKFFDAISISVDDDSELNPSPNLVNKRVNPGPWKYAPDSSTIDAQNSIAMQHYINWVNHCQNRGQFIPYRYSYNYEEEKTRVTAGKMGASRPKGSNGKHHKSHWHPFLTNDDSPEATSISGCC